jgi:hypothetical protein
MDMAVDMVLAEAMIPCAFGAIAEFEFRMIRLGATAYGALVDIEFPFLFFADTLRLPTKIHGVHAVLPSREENTDPLIEISPAEENEVQDGNNRQKIIRETGSDDPNDKKDCVYQCQPFDTYRQDEEQKHLHIREKSRKRKKHRKVNVMCVYAETQPGEEIDNKSIECGEKHPAEEIDREAAGAPLGLQYLAHHIVKIKSDKSQEACAYRNEDERDEPPDLTVQDVIR